MVLYNLTEICGVLSTYISTTTLGTPPVVFFLVSGCFFSVYLRLCAVVREGDQCIYLTIMNKERNCCLKVLALAVHAYDQELCAERLC